jgi:hypothetical protein
MFSADAEFEAHPIQANDIEKSALSLSEDD